MLKSQSSNDHASDRVALIGKAATKLHPITGQGFNLSMTASALLSNSIINQMKGGGDIGNYQFGLKNFAHQSKINEFEMRVIIEMINKGYEDKFFGCESIGKALSFVRNIGMDIIEANPIIKYNVAFLAAGCTNHPLSYEWEQEY